MRLRRGPGRPESFRGRRAGVPVLSLALLAAGVAGTVVPTGAQAAPSDVALVAANAGVSRPGDLQTVRATFDPTGTPHYQASTRNRLAPLATTGGVDTANITVTYSAGFDAAAKAAFQSAVDIWKKQVVSTVPIRIDAQWSPLGTGVLGQAGPVNFRRDFTGAPRSGTFYPDALANAVAGRDLDPTKPEIQARFNSAFGAWYKGTDGRPGALQYDFKSVVLHELGHGLGFVGTFDGLNPPTYQTDTGRGYWGLDFTGDAPTSFDRLAVDNAGRDALDTSVYAQGSTALGALLRGGNGGVQWKGTNAVANNNGVRPRLYSPSIFEPGSSFSHLDENAYPAGSPNALMTPFLANNESAHDPGAIVRGMLVDIGWPTAIPTPNSAITDRYTALGGSAGILGPATSIEFLANDLTGRYMTFRNGAIYWSSASGAREVHGMIRTKWSALKGETGVLRYPITDEKVAPDGVGRYNDFQGGSVYWSSPTGAIEVHGAIRTKWQQMNTVKGVLRYPTTDERVAPDRVGRYNHFQGGSVYWSPATGAREIHGLIKDKWAALGWEKSRLGYPTSDEFGVAEGRKSTFQHGSITYVAKTRALVVRYT